MNYASLAAEMGIIGFISGEELRAKCPLHDDSNPSFSLNLQTGLWICFSRCGGGSFVDLVQKVLSYNFAEANEWIKTNGKRVSIQQLENQLELEFHRKPESPHYMPLDAGYITKYNSLTSDIMPLWFLERGFTWETIWKWRIRYDPIWDAVTIPVFMGDQFVGTITRNTQPQFPKYQNSPNLPKTEMLFGEISPNQNYIILVEGCLDTLWLWQNGYNVGGLLGTSISGTQLDILKRYKFGEIVLALDNDKAGIEATTKVMNQLLAAGWMLPQISFITFPEGFKDANDCWPDEFAQLYAQRKGFIH